MNSILVIITTGAAIVTHEIEGFETLDRAYEVSEKIISLSSESVSIACVTFSKTGAADE